jgi:hypothetical protein
MQEGANKIVVGDVPFKPPRNKKLIIGVIAAVAIILIGSVWALLNYINNRSIKVGSTTITKQQLDTYAKAVDKFQKENEAKFGDGTPAETARDDLILNAALKQEAKKYGVLVGQQDMDSLYGGKIGYEVYLSDKGVKEVVLLRAENDVYKAKLKAKLINTKDLFYVALPYDSPYFSAMEDHGASKDGENVTLLEKEFLPLFKEKKSKEEIASKADVNLLISSSSNSNPALYMERAVTLADFIPSYGTGNSEFNDFPLDKIRNNQNVVSTNDKIRELTEIGQDTGVIKTASGYFMIMRLEGKSEGVFESWEEFLDSYKKQALSQLPSGNHMAAYFTNFLHKVDDKLTPKASANDNGTCGEHNVEFHVYARDEATEAEIPNGTVNIKHNSSCPPNADKDGSPSGPGTNYTTVAGGWAGHSNITVVLLENCWSTEPTWNQSPTAGSSGQYTWSGRIRSGQPPNNMYDGWPLWIPSKINAIGIVDINVYYKTNTVDPNPQQQDLAACNAISTNLAVKQPGVYKATPGQSFSATVQFKNVGTASGGASPITWTHGGGPGTYRAASTPNDSAQWGLSRADAPSSETTPVNDIVTITFTAKAPTVSSNEWRSFDWRLKKESTSFYVPGVNGVDATCNTLIYIEVNDAPTPPPTANACPGIDGTPDTYLTPPTPIANSSITGLYWYDQPSPSQTPGYPSGQEYIEVQQSEWGALNGIGGNAYLSLNGAQREHGTAGIFRSNNIKGVKWRGNSYTDTLSVFDLTYTNNNGATYIYPDLNPRLTSNPYDSHWANIAYWPTVQDEPIKFTGSYASNPAWFADYSYTYYYRYFQNQFTTFGAAAVGSPYQRANTTPVRTPTIGPCYGKLFTANIAGTGASVDDVESPTTLSGSGTVSVTFNYPPAPAPQGKTILDPTSVNLGATYTFSRIKYPTGVKTDFGSSYQAVTATIPGGVTLPRSTSVATSAVAPTLPTDLTAGDRLCYTIRLAPTSGEVKGSSPTPVTQAGDQVVGPFCVTISDKPYFKVHDGDVISGGTFKSGTSCTTVTTTAGIKAYSTKRMAHPYYGGPNATYYSLRQVGSGVEYAAMANRAVNGFASAQAISTSFPTPAGFTTSPVTYLPWVATFANSNPTATTLAGLIGSRTAYGGNFGNNFCVPDFFTTTRTDLAPSPIGTNLNRIPIGQQFLLRGSNLTLDNGANPLELKNGEKSTIYVENGSVHIKSNITYKVEARTNRDQIPYLVIIVKNGNIYVDPSVTHLSGVYIAQPGNPTQVPSVNGRVYTCANGFAPVAAAAMFETCKNRLLFDGAVIAQQVKLHRTRSSLRSGIENEQPSTTVPTDDGRQCGHAVPATSDSCAAEIFRLSPEVYVGIPILRPTKTPGEIRYDYISSLPPTL